MDGSDYESVSRRHNKALQDALSRFRLLFTISSGWKILQPPSASSASRSDQSRPSFFSATSSRPLNNGVGPVDASELTVHKHKSKGNPDIVKASIDVPVGDAVDIDDFRAVMVTPELCPVWNKLADSAKGLELPDAHTRVVKTDFRLGWPASPRDSVTISQTLCHQSTMVDVSTSIPPSPENPAYLRRSPPYVRSHTHLLGFCVQLPHPSSRSQYNAKARVTVVWQWDLKGVVFSQVRQQIGSLLVGYVDHVRGHGDKVPLLSNFGGGIRVACPRFDPSQDVLNVDYDIVHSSQCEGPSSEDNSPQATRDLEHSTEFSIPKAHGWDVQIVVRNPSAESRNKRKSVESMKHKSSSTSLSNSGYTATAECHSHSSRVILRISHRPPAEETGIIRVSIIIHRLVGGSFIRVNRNQVHVTTIEDTSSRNASNLSTELNSSLKGDTTPKAVHERSPIFFPQVSNSQGSPLSTTAPFLPTLASSANGSKSFDDDDNLLDEQGHASDAASMMDTMTTSTATSITSPRSLAVASAIRRSYIYFTSLLQEPEPKWKQVSDSRGVNVMQLASIDPTLTIYRAEATFVGVAVWDLFASVLNSGALLFWDKTVDGIRVVEELDELSKILHTKTKNSWPTAPRDSVVVNTSYKSPQAIHIFSFSADDPLLFPNVPSIDPGVIRSQIDLRGWAIEALSPTTTLVTLIDQSDPKGWSNKSWAPQQMVNQVADLGEFTIKNGGPPILTRLTNATMSSFNYIHDKGTLKIEYFYDSAAPSYILPVPDSDDTIQPIAGKKTSVIEAEIRCDVGKWASNLDVMIDPPPSKTSCLSRHRLSSGGGSWITIEHDRDSIAMENRIAITIRKGASSREKGSIYVNGIKVQVDVEQVSDEQLRTLSKRKRIKMPIIPLDQYSAPKALSIQSEHFDKPTRVGNSGNASETSSLASSPLRNRTHPSSTHLLDYGASISGRSTPTLPITTISNAVWTNRKGSALQMSHNDVSYVLEALAWLQGFYTEQGADPLVPSPGWTVVLDKSPAAGVSVRKQIIHSISPSWPVFRYDKVIQGLTAEQLVPIVSSPSARHVWDERAENVALLASFGNGCSSSSFTTKSSFFGLKGRCYRVASARGLFKIPSASAGSSTSNVYLCSTASHPVQGIDIYDPESLNPASLPLGRIFFEGWIFETLDPYTSDKFAIPSTRCTYFTSNDQGGSITQAFGSSNPTSLRTIDNLEGFVKSHGSIPRLVCPIPNVYIDGPLSSEGADDCAWKISESGVHTASSAVTKCVHTDYLYSARRFNTVLSLPPESVSNFLNDDSQDTDPSMPSSSESATTPRSSSVRDLQSISSKGSLKNSTNPASKVHGKSMSVSPDSSMNSVSAGLLRHYSSTSQLRSEPSAYSKKTQSRPTTASTMKGTDSSPAEELILAEMVIDLKHYPSGYRISCSVSINDHKHAGKDGVLRTGLSFPFLTSSTDLPIQCDINPQKRLSQDSQIPLRATAKEMPVPAAESASLTQTNISQTRHLLQVTLLVAQVNNSIRDVAGTNGEETEHPEWFKNILQDGAIVDLVVEPLTDEAEPQVTINSNTTNVIFNGSKIDVSELSESDDVVSETENNGYKLLGPTISRVPQGLGRGNHEMSMFSHESNLPPELEKPMLVNIEKMTKRGGNSHGNNNALVASENGSKANKESAAGATNDQDSKDDVSHTTANDENSSAVTTSSIDGEPQFQSQISRFASTASASLLNSISTSSAATSSPTVPFSPNVPGGIPSTLATTNAQSKDGKDDYSLELESGAKANHQQVSQQDNNNKTKMFSLAFVIIVAIIAFLLGSLLRSLLTPADFIMYPRRQPSEAFIPESVLSAVDDSRRWKHARRILEFRWPTADWDIIVAQVWKRQPVN